MFVKREFVTWELQWRIKGSLKLSRWILLTFVPKMFTILLSILWYILYLFTALIKHNSFCAIMLSFYTTYFVQFPSSITVAALSYDCKNLILQKWNIEFNNKKKRKKRKEGNVQDVPQHWTTSYAMDSAHENNKKKSSLSSCVESIVEVISRYCETPYISCMKVGFLFRFSSCVNLRCIVAVVHILWWRVRLGWWIERNGFVTFFTHYDKSGAFFFQLCQGLCSAILLAQTMPVKYHRWLRGWLVINDREGTHSDKVSRCNGDRAEEIEYRSS